MIYALIVLYNKKLDDSLTYKCLRKYNKKLNLIVYDNSQKEYIDYNRIYCHNNNIKYYTLCKNVGLSKAYNYIINKIEINDKNYIIMLDDDTTLNDNYFNILFKMITDNSIDIFLPVVYSNDKIISPSNVSNGCRIKSVKNINKIDISRISAINTAMVVKTTVFNKLKYNEELFLDYVDHDFMMRIRKNNYKIQVMNVSIYQNFSRFEISSLDKEIFRFKIYTRDFKKYCKECNKLWFYYVSTIKYRLQKVIKYKNIQFLLIR